jgi:hypothetical protein
MATLFNNVANTLTTNFVPVQATFDTSGNFLTFIGPGGVPFTAGSSLSINSTPITGGTSGRVLYDNAGAVGELPTTGTGNVVLSDSPTFTTAITSTGSLQLAGSSTAYQEIATSQTSGTLTVGGTSATGLITLGRSTGVQTVGIATGANSSSAKTVNIGTGSTGGATTINLGAVSGATTNGATTISLGNQTRSVGTTTIRIGAGVNSGTASTSIIIGTSSSGSSIQFFGNTSFSGTTSFNALTLPKFTSTTTSIVDDLLGFSVGTRAFVTDALSPVFGQPVVGGGTVGVPVYIDNTSTWRVG